MHRIIAICHYHHQNIMHIDEKIKNMSQLTYVNSLNIEYKTTDYCHMSYYHLLEDRHIFSYVYNDIHYHVMFIGNIYNLEDIKQDLLKENYQFHTYQEEEIILLSYLHYGKDCLNLFNGGFSFVIYSDLELFACRDQLGIVPLYYTLQDNALIISNEIKCLLAYIGKAIVDQNGIKELLALGPSLTPGTTLYKDIYSLKPGYYFTYKDKLETYCYYRLQDLSHHDSLQQSIQKVRTLVEENILQHIKNKHDTSTMLSGGLDSSIITAVTAKKYPQLDTFSITYEKQNKYFQAYEYQTTMDDDYIHQMIQQYDTHHRTCTLSCHDLINTLKDALIARDMPGMADIDSSFLLFCKYISKYHTSALSGECADEIFGGYPWFYKEELLKQPHFPWLRELDKKMELFSPQIKQLHLKDYIHQKYQETIQQSLTNDPLKQLIYLHKEWFMQTLLTRAYTQSLYASINIQVPFASTKIIQYLYNMPKTYMFAKKEEKGLLRLAFEDILPYDITHRKKNPYPKTHSPLYKELIYQKLKESLQDSDNILYQLFDMEKLNELVETKGESFQYPWFGQLMMGPQLLAYLYQIYLWAKIYHIELDI